MKMDTAENAEVDLDIGAELSFAARCGDLEDVRRIIVQAKAKSDAILSHALEHTDDLSGNTALHLCSANGHVDIVKSLLSAGAAVNAVNKSGSTALHYASLTGHLDVVRALLAYGGNAVVENNFGKTALDEALSGRQDEVKDFLLRFIEKKKDMPSTFASEPEGDSDAKTSGDNGE